MVKNLKTVVDNLFILDEPSCCGNYSTRLYYHNSKPVVALIEVFGLPICRVDYTRNILVLCTQDTERTTIYRAVNALRAYFETYEFKRLGNDFQLYQFNEWYDAKVYLTRQGQWSISVSKESRK